VGFVFGIPKSLQQKETPAKDDARSGESLMERSAYRGNTNLEEISDWLTKILVGVGLTQLLRIPGSLGAFAAYLAPAFGKEPAAERFALALLLYFPTSGFLFGYLWTRLFLGKALSQADRLANIEKKVNAQQQQAQADANALAQTYQHLAAGPSTVPTEPLKAAIRASSPAVRVTIFNQAREVRSKNWLTDKTMVERTIPVFEALIDSDTDGRLHRNYGQIGYALKDQTQPDWARAEQNLSRAIRVRGPWRDTGWVLYELNRAVCRIMQDADYKADKKSLSARRESILADLRVGWRLESHTMFQEDPIRKWMGLNNVSELDVDQEPE